MSDRFRPQDRVKAIRKFLAIDPHLDPDLKGGLIILVWIAWVFLVMAAGQHFGWITP